MKHTKKRLFCVLLAVALVICLLSTAVLAEEPTDEELIAQYRIPNTWARPALLFAVRNGLLVGDGYSLQPESKITRAEVAAMLTRILQVSAQADLSVFSDVDPDAWYAEPLSHAVAAGLISGYTDGTVRPGANITREEAFSMIYRLTGITGGIAEDLNDFRDGSTVGVWARDCMMSMICAGYIHGSANCLNPKSNITRQEFAQVLYEIFSGIGTEISSKYTGSFALASDTVPAKTKVTGDLLLSSEASEITLQNVTVSGRLIIQGCGVLTLNLENCKIGTLVLCRSCEVNIADGTVDRVTVHAPSTVHGVCGSVEVWADTVFDGTAHSSVVVKGTLDASAATVEKTYSTEDYRQAQLIKRVRIAGHTTKKTTLYTSWDRSGYHDPIRTLSSNTSFTLLSHRFVAYEVLLPDGTIGFLAPDAVSISSAKTYVSDDYSQNVKECYVNFLRTYTSRTNYLIWINRRTLKLCVFEKNSGQWDLIRSVPCAIGKNDTPTQEEVIVTNSKSEIYDAGDHYYHHVTWFWPNAIHSRLYWNDGTFYDSSMSKTVSDGCVRLYDEDAIWVYDTLPTSTTVVVY